MTKNTLLVLVILAIIVALLAAWLVIVAARQTKNTAPEEQVQVPRPVEKRPSQDTTSGQQPIMASVEVVVDNVNTLVKVE